MCSHAPPALSRGLGPVHAEQETEIHVDGQPGGAEHVPKLPCVDVSKVAAAGHIGDEPAHPFPARGVVDGHVHEHVHTHGAHVRRGLVWPAAPMPSMPAPYWAERRGICSGCARP